MAPHSSVFTWRIPQTEEPGGLQSVGSRRVWHDWATSLSLFTFMHWRRKWQPTRVLAWRIPGTGEPGGLRSMGSHRVGHDWSDLAAAAAAYLGLPRWHSCKESACQCRRCRRHGFDPWVGKITWWRQWQSTPVFLLGESHGQWSLASYSPWGRKESDMTE